MEPIQTSSVECPYCGEPVELVIDCSIEQQDYIEDCSVCCRPILISVLIEEFPTISVKRDND